MLPTDRPLKLTETEEALIIAIRKARYARITELLIVEGQPFAMKTTRLEQKLDLSKSDIRNEVLDLADALQVPVDFSPTAENAVVVETKENSKNPEETENSSEQQPS